MSFSEPGKFPLVLDPVVAEVRLTKVLIDGGSGLNLIFASTLWKMGLDLSGMLVLSKSPFYGIVPGNAAHPLGTVVLPVTFGTRENYHTEFIKFEVVPDLGVSSPKLITLGISLGGQPVKHRHQPQVI
jgi:hypothetical protein